jgi:hypothetical protein
LEVAFVRVWANPSGVIVYSKDNSQPVILSQDRVHWTLTGHVWNSAVT